MCQHVRPHKGVTVRRYPLLASRVFLAEGGYAGLSLFPIGTRGRDHEEGQLSAPKETTALPHWHEVRGKTLQRRLAHGQQEQEHPTR